MGLAITSRQAFSLPQDFLVVPFESSSRKTSRERRHQSKYKQMLPINIQLNAVHPDNSVSTVPCAQNLVLQVFYQLQIS